MNYKFYMAAALACAYGLPVAADPQFYGKANVTLEYADIGGESGDSETIELVSNASRIGVKGSETIHDGLEVIYQLEYETYFDDGVNGGQRFGQRNIFAGVQGGFGKLIGGHFDTPLKASQDKVDLFNDLRGDIKNLITPNELRTSNTVMYTTPSMGGVTVNLAHIASEEENIDSGVSVSIGFQSGGFYISGAMEQDVDGEYTEAQRIVSLYSTPQFQVGALYEINEEALADSESGWILSGLYNIGKSWALKAQYGQSDMIVEGGETLSLGLDHIYTKNFKTLAFVTRHQSDDDAIDNIYAGVGLDFKF